MSVPREAVEWVFREEWGRILASLIRVLNDFDLAEEAMQDAFTIALERWPEDGVPENPGAWITTVARRKAVDRIRRGQRVVLLPDSLEHLPAAGEDPIAVLESRLETSIEDDRLRLMFTCCHPALNHEAQVALTLRTLGGLTTPEIARAFLVPAPTMAQRLVRAKRKIKTAGIPYRVPPDHLLPERLPSVLSVAYLIFNEGYSASEGDLLIRRELCAEAVRLTRILRALMPGEPEVLGLLALLLFQDSRRNARVDSRGETVLLEDQDRAKWNHAEIREGKEILRLAEGMGAPGSYRLQAAIAEVHSTAARAEDTDWRRIVALYDRLIQLHPSPVVGLNRAVAVAMSDGADRGLELVEEIGRSGKLEGYLYFHSTRAELLRRCGLRDQARDAFRQALALAENSAEQRFLQQRLEKC